MSRILVTGSTDGIGRAAATALQRDGHSVVVHARNEDRLRAVSDLMANGADGIVGDLGELDRLDDLIEQANTAGPFDAVIHNAGVIGGRALLPVNVVAPYVLTARIERPSRLVYLSSSMHRSGRVAFADAGWSSAESSSSYSDSKLWVTILMAAVARLWPGVLSHAVDPGWVPTRMGGSAASDDLRLAHVTQNWLATTTSPDALVSGRYWFHRRTQSPHPAVHDEELQDALLASLAEHTGVELTPE